MCSLSLGTYSIGLMQSSSVKSEMYPIWAVSMLTLLGCVDSSTAYGLDYSSQLSKMLSQLCLYCGYVMLISMSSISSRIGYIAIGVLSAITFIKGFHRSLALVLPSKLSNTNRMIAHHMEKEVLRMDHGHRNFNVLIRATYYNPLNLTGYRYVFYWIPRKETDVFIPAVTIDEIWRCNSGKLRRSVRSWKDVCLSLSLSHLLQRRLFGLKCAESELQMTRDFVFEGLMKENDHERAFKVIEMELAFLYDVFFTSNAFLYYYESKVASIWACASVIGICFVGVAAVIPGTKLLRTYDSDTIVVGTTMTDLVFTVFILVTMASLQALQLLRCWTSNWARVALVCDYIMSDEEASCWMRWRALMLLMVNKWFDRHLWQRKLGQYSLIESLSRSECSFFIRALKARLYQIYSLTSVMLGLQYIEQVLHEMWGVQTGDAVALHTDVKAAIIRFVIKHKHEVKTGIFSFPSQSSTAGNRNRIPWIKHCRGRGIVEVILRWHVASCYFELELKRRHQHSDEENHHGSRNGSGSGGVNPCSGVAITLSKYCAYLVVSAPELLPGQQVYTKSMHDEVMQAARIVMQGESDKLEAMKSIWSELYQDEEKHENGREMMDKVLYGLGKDVESNEAWREALIRLSKSDSNKQKGFFNHSAGEDAESRDVITWKKAAELFKKSGGSHDGFRIFWEGLELANQLQSTSNYWKVLEDFWVQALLYAAPSDNVEEHVEHLAKGGEFITHLWALLSHAGILRHEWSETAAATADKDAQVAFA